MLAGNRKLIPLLFRISILILKNIKTLDQILSFLVKLHSSASQKSPTAGPTKNLEAQLFFQITDRDRQTRLADIHFFRCFSKGPTISNSDYITQLLNIHNIFLLYISSHYTINQGRTKETSCKKPVSPFKLMSNLRQICYFSFR